MPETAPEDEIISNLVIEDDYPYKRMVQHHCPFADVLSLRYTNHLDALGEGGDALLGLKFDQLLEEADLLINRLVASEAINWRVHLHLPRQNSASLSNNIPQLGVYRTIEQDPVLFSSTQDFLNPTKRLRLYRKNDRSADQTGLPTVLHHPVLGHF
ncbi:unnamed protein product [Rhizoctonia solani]|uniref:Uncharacterized protein n=1 Tax=Rhizoctonia solani TaxID=456999 RepID=A0A8H3DKG8_9AGAM|nr:unnamed protein product [Rhizoctonia solani]